MKYFITIFAYTAISTFFSLLLNFIRNLFINTFLFKKSQKMKTFFIHFVHVNRVIRICIFIAELSSNKIWKPAQFFHPSVILMLE